MEKRTRKSSGRATLTTASASRQASQAEPSRRGRNLISIAPQIRSADSASPGRRCPARAPVISTPSISSS